MKLELVTASNPDAEREAPLDLAMLAELRERMRRALNEEPLLAGLEDCARDLLRHLRIDLVEIWWQAQDQPVVQQVVVQGRTKPLDAPALVPLTGGNPVARCARSGEAGVYDAGSSSLPVDFQRWMQREGLASHAVYPLRASAGTIGVLAVFARRNLDDHFPSLLAFVADMLASALDRARRQQNYETCANLIAGIEQVEGVALVAFDRDCRVRLWNAGARRLFGWAREEVEGIGLPIVPDGTHHLLLQVFDEMLRGEHIPGGQRASKLTRDGNTVHLIVSTIPLLDSAGSVAGTLGVFTPYE
jgi:PAS domain S-box-containing protein